MATTRGRERKSARFMEVSWFSAIPEQRWEHENHHSRPGGEHGQVRNLPSLQNGERAPVTQEARVQPRRPRQVDEKNDVLAKSRDPVGREAKFRDAGSDRRERHPVDHECADDKRQL